MKNALILLALGAGLANTANADELYLLDFEAAGGYTTSTPEFSDIGISSGGDYFTRTNGSNISSSVSYTNQSGYYFGAQDIDGEGASLPLSLTTDSFSIAGATNLQFAVDLAEDDDGSSQDWDAPDFVRFEYAVDGGAWQEIFTAENDGSSFNSPAFINGVEITDTFSTFSAALAGVTGSMMQLRIIFSLDAGDEDIAIDNMMIFGETTMAVVPLPPAAFAGLGLLGAMGAARRLRA